MKILISLLLISNICFSQSIERAITDIVDSKISAFSYTLDSVVVRNVSSSSIAPFNIDTLKIPVGRNVLYLLSLKAQSFSSSDAGFGIKIIHVVNTGGVYSVSSNRDLLGWGGSGSLSPKINWNVITVNGLAVVRITGLNSLINWTLTKSEL